MEMSYGSIALSVFAVFVTFSVYRILNWVWFRPRKLEKCLREQGFHGNPYRVLVGDQKKSGIMIREALSKPISLSDDIKPRVIPHVLETIKKYGTNSFMWVGEIPRVHITEPELIREVLHKYHRFHKNLHSLDPITRLLATGVTVLEDEPWAKRRKLLNPAFHFEKLKLMLPAFYLSSLDMVNKWEKMISPKGSGEVEIHYEFETFTGDAISRTLFGSSFEEGRKIFELTKELTVLTTQVIQSVYIPGWRFMPTKRNNRMKAINKVIRGLITKMLNEKMKSMNGRDRDSKSSDFLGILLECNMNEIELQKNKNAGLSFQEIIDEVKIFYFAGQDTTSNLLCWTMVLLSIHPEWQTRAREEVLQVFGNNEPNYDGLNRLKIMTMIFNEVMRLYPPVIELTKVPTEDTKLGDVTIPAGVQLMMPTIILHHDPKIWGDDAKEFNPERFSQGVINAAKEQGSFFPFSLGPRMCIGQNYAMIESKIALATILQRFSFELSPSYKHAPYTLVTLQPQFGAPLILHKL